MTVRASARRALNSVLRHGGLELVHPNSSHDWQDPEQFLPFQATLHGAKAAGMSVSDYVEVKHNRLGSTQETLDNMAALGVFGDRVRSICEIGPGSGRYLYRTLEACKPEHYEIYETAKEWAAWLAETYPVILRPTDGRTLAATPSGSIDLAHAHKVFVATPSLTTLRYLLEMARVVRPGGKAVFDIVTEECMDDSTLDAWLSNGHQSGPYPAMMPKQFVVGLMARHDFMLRGTFFTEMRPGRTECLVFFRNA